MNQIQDMVGDADPTAISIAQAMRRIVDSLTRCTEQETISCRAAHGRYLSRDVICQLDIPPFRASAMDGYAVRSAECDQPLRLVGESLAGHPGEDRLPRFCTQRITTGARVPDDADAVVQQENVIRNDDQIIVNQQPDKGLHVRPSGSDSVKGTVLLEAGTRLGAAEQALLATHGITQVPVVRQLRIAIFSTGDELVEPGSTRLEGQIFDANRTLLLNMLDDPSVQLKDLGIGLDSRSDLQRLIEMTGDADIVLSSGGVSVGDADHVKAVLEANGRMGIWKIAMKPGRPLTFGLLGPNKAFFGLPGNPVSAALTCLLFVKPAITHTLGGKHETIPAMQLPLEGALTKNPGRIEYQRAIMKTMDDGQWVVSTTGLQDSHVLTSLHKANCLIELPIDSTGAEPGDIVQVFPFTHFSHNAL